MEAEGSWEPIEAVDAACVILLRDSPDGVETYLVTCPERSPFGPVAFPGGPVAAEDDDPLPWSGPPATEWGARWGDDVGSARRVAVTAIRELFEITGVLLAGQDGHSTAETMDGRDWLAVRQQVLARQLGFKEMLERRRLALRTDLLWPIARWATPDFLHRRYDIRYFAVILPERQTVTELPGHPRPGAWVPLKRLAAHIRPDGAAPSRGGDASSEREGLEPDSWLGDTIGARSTAGKPQSVLLSANVSCLIQELAGVRSVVEAIAHPGDLGLRQPQLRRDDDGTFQLVVAPSIRHGRTRERAEAHGGWRERGRADAGAGTTKAARQP